MRHRGKPFLAGDVVQFRPKKDGSENLFARWSRWHRNHRVGSPARSGFLQGSNLFHAAQTRVIGVSRLNQSR
jgi:hypothetical protein